MFLRQEAAAGQATSVLPESTPLAPAEWAEFARVLGVSADILTSPRSPACPSEDGDSMASYEALMADPLKSLVADHPDYYARLKVELVLDIVGRCKPECSRESLRLLDVGCGPGELMRKLSAHYDHVWGCDPAQSMVRRAGSRALAMPGPTEIPCADDSFDVAICACVCHHVEPAIRLAHLSEVWRVLRPGGLSLVFEHNPRNPLTRRIVKRCPIDSNAHLLTASHIRKLLRAAGFSDLVTRYYLFLPERLRPYLKFVETALSFTGMGGQYLVLGSKPEIRK